MDSDKTKWNNRYKNDKMPSNVSELLVECEGFLPHEGRALDIACGNGRNLRFLAQRGLMSEGIDISEVALEGLDGLPNIRTHCLDLDGYTLERDSFDVILNFYFLDREILAQVGGALRMGGVVVLETFIQDREYPSSMDKHKILRQGELEEIFKGFEVLHHSFKVIERDYQKERAKVVSFVAKKC